MSSVFAERMARLRAAMKQTGTGLVAIGPGSHMQWLAGFYPHPDERPCLLLVGPEKAGFLMPALNAEAARLHSDLPMFEWADATGPDAALSAAIDAIFPQRTGRIVIDETMRADFAFLLADALPVLPRAFTQDTLGLLRSIKDEDEYRRLKACALLNDAAMKAARAALKPGMTENAVAEVVRGHFSQNGGQPLFWIVGASENGAHPHHATGDRVLKTGDAVVLDIGGRLDGYPSDMTRMAIIGEEPEGYREVHAIVERAVQAALAAAKPGAKASDVDRAARDVIADAGYGDYFVHRTGHGLGIDAHEPPYITATSDVVLEEGMVFSIEPGIYLPGRFGIRLEDIVILRADGPEIFSELPRDAYVA
ncbi:Xaa-Pro peptidase family protein [Mesorhizobium sp. CAU 1741]|uniref:M24 family metallopeptidase n=1 Tax=Mesorhizobium sp. CAU 1741 TaxID=3140366 RepID=UPI00325C1B58